MKKLNLIPLCSDLNRMGDITESHAALFMTLRPQYDVQILSPDQYAESDKPVPTFVFIASGGSEERFVQAFDKLPRPIVLLTDGLQNSLAASLEINTWTHQQHVPCQTIHGEGQALLDQVNKVYTELKTLSQLYGKRIGVIGTPSSWLIASGVDYAAVRQKWGVEYLQIPLQEVVDFYEKTDMNEADSVATRVMQMASRIIEPSVPDVVAAARVYLAIKSVVNKYKLDALTLQCFELISQIHTTGCLALALLNDEGIPAGCEGDEQSVFTMLLTHCLTDCPGFMANPSKVCTKENTVLFAHCTIGISQTSYANGAIYHPDALTYAKPVYSLRTHFESGIGVAIQGLMPEGDYTVVKFGGKQLDKMFVSKAEFMDNTSFENVCRTQFILKLEKPVNYFLENPIGNHHIIVPGDWQKQFMQFFNI